MTMFLVERSDKHLDRLDDLRIEVAKLKNINIRRENMNNEEQKILKSPAKIQECIKRQYDVCHKERVPHFAPANGICIRCKRQIYQVVDGSKFITGCPLCHYSYCD